MHIRRLILGLLPYFCGSLSLGAAPVVTDPVECQLKSGEWAQCLWLDVPENRAQPTTRLIKLHSAIFRAQAPSKDKAPIYLLAGGPGQAATEGFVPLPETFRRLRRYHDIVLIDQRGTGESHPLRCLQDRDPKWELTFDENLFQSHMKNCFERLQKDTDLTAYTTDAAVADMEAVREALGHRKIILFGVSYGTRLGLRYLALHPDRVEKQILEGVLPPDVNIAREKQSFAPSLQGVAALCRKDPSCQAYGDPWANFQTLQTLFAQRPRVRLTDPRSGEVKEVTLRPDLLDTLVRSLLYSPVDMSIVPKILHEAVKGHYGPMIAKAFSADFGIYDGLYFLLMCAEDFRDMGEALNDSQKMLSETCRLLPNVALPPNFRQQPRSEVPTLLLSGGLDPVTPPRYTESLKPVLPQETHLILADYGHNISYVGCIQDAMISFIDSKQSTLEHPACLKQLRALHFFKEGKAP